METSLTNEIPLVNVFHGTLPVAPETQRTMYVFERDKCVLMLGCLFINPDLDYI